MNLYFLLLISAQENERGVQAQPRLAHVAAVVVRDHKCAEQEYHGRAAKQELLSRILRPVRHPLQRVRTIASARLHPVRGGDKDGRAVVLVLHEQSVLDDQWRPAKSDSAQQSPDLCAARAQKPFRHASRHHSEPELCRLLHALGLLKCLQH